MLSPVKVCIIFTVSLWVSACKTPRPVSEGAAESAPPARQLGDFSLKDVDNRPHALSDYLGEKVVVMSFFAMWCEPCKKELAHLDPIYRAHRDKGLIMLAISMDEPETQGEVRPFAKQRDFAFPVLLDTEGTATGLFNPRRDAPYNLIIDKSRTIVWSKAGYTPGDERLLETAILEALGTRTTP